MFKNYFKTAWHSLMRGKSFSLINIAGLAIGMAGAMLILLWLQNEISFDKFHANKDNLYQVYGLSATDGNALAIDVVSQPLGPALKQNYPEVEASTRVKDYGKFLLTANNKSFTNIKSSWVAPAFLYMFRFPLVEGNKINQLKNTYSITITQRLAQKLFGKEDALGKIVASIIIATPVAWYTMSEWLQSYAYRINISWIIFFIAGLMAIAIALLTVSYQSIKAAIANPVKSLRTE